MCGEHRVVQAGGQRASHTRQGQQLAEQRQAGQGVQGAWQGQQGAGRFW
jgi:hypothetical protein